MPVTFRDALRTGRRHAGKLLLVIAILVAAAVTAVLIVVPSAPELLARGDTRSLRDGPEPAARPGQPAVLILALDGVDRALLYQMLRAGELPGFERLLGGMSRAFFDDTLFAPMPTSTIPSWATIFTGATPAVHGVVGNEYFIRAEQRYAGPNPVSVFDPDLVLQVYTDGYANRLLGAPTLYQRLRVRDPQITVWVAMSQFYEGADRLILADRTVIAEAFTAFLDADSDDDDAELAATLDEEVIENLEEELGKRAAPRVLTVYLGGADLVAHEADVGPDLARRRYLRDVVDGLADRLAVALDRAGARADRHVVVISDHGHTEVMRDARHALGTDDEDDPPALIRRAGYRLRKFETDADGSEYDTVLAYGGATAFVYLADRSACADGRGCDWSRPPRFAEDVVPLADAFLAEEAIDLVLVRAPGAAPPARFEVYLGGGRTEAVDAHLRRRPRDGYVDVARRLDELAVGPRGDHAGDLLLIAKNGAEAAIGDRYYFSNTYHSWHGSPNRRDSELPLIVAHPGRSAAAIEQEVRRLVGERTDATEITPLIEGLLGEGGEDPTGAALPDRR
jgi:hypothetical protein